MTDELPPEEPAEETPTALLGSVLVQEIKAALDEQKQVAWSVSAAVETIGGQAAIGTLQFTVASIPRELLPGTRWDAGVKLSVEQPPAPVEEEEVPTPEPVVGPEQTT